jgi:hypothetical protein
MDEFGERWTLGSQDLALLADLPDAGKLGPAAIARWLGIGRASAYRVLGARVPRT